MSGCPLMRCSLETRYRRDQYRSVNDPENAGLFYNASAVIRARNDANRQIISLSVPRSEKTELCALTALTFITTNTSLFFFSYRSFRPVFFSTDVLRHCLASVMSEILFLFGLSAAPFIVRFHSSVHSAGDARRSLLRRSCSIAEKESG